MKYALLMIVLFFVPCAFAGPTPEADESFASFKTRYIAWYDAIAAEDRAWEEMVEINALLNDRLGELNPTHNSDDPDWEASAAFVRQQGELLDRIRAYTTRSALAIPPGELFDEEAGDEFPKAFSILLPHLGIIRNQSELLLIDAILASQGGAYGRAIADFRAVRRLEGFLPATNSMIELLVDLAISDMVAHSVLAAQIDLSGWSAQELAQLSIVFQDPKFVDRMIRASSNERWGVGDMLGWLYEDADDGRISLLGAKRFLDMTSMLGTLDGDSFTTGSRFEGVSKIARAISLRLQIRPLQDQEALVDELFGLIMKDQSTPPNKLRRFELDERIESLVAKTTSRTEYAPVVVIIPDFSRLYRQVARADAVESAASLLIALHRHHRRHGSFPEMLDEMDRDLLIVDPVDPYADQSLRYTLVDGSPVIYSLGPDRDDDGGRPILDKDATPERWPEFLTLDELDALDEAGRAAIDGDWVLYPAVR